MVISLAFWAVWNWFLLSNAKIRCVGLFHSGVDIPFTELLYDIYL